MVDRGCVGHCTIEAAGLKRWEKEGGKLLWDCKELWKPCRWYDKKFVRIKKNIFRKWSLRISRPEGEGFLLLSLICGAARTRLMQDKMLLGALLIASLIAFFLYVYLRLSRGIVRSSTCLSGKTAIITGANSGIGYQTALNLASRGCRVIMADTADMAESKLNIIKYSGNSNIVAKKLELASLKSVREFAQDIVEKEENLHILINNAGVGATNYGQTEDGLHSVMQINYFGHFLLTHLLIDLLKKSTPSRICFTSSAASYFSRLNLKNLNCKRKSSNFLTAFAHYANSKLAIIIASDFFNEKLKGTGVISNAVHPGFVETQIFSRMGQCHAGFFLNVLTQFGVFFFKDAWEGSQVLIYTAVSRNVEAKGGRFWIDCKEAIKPIKALDKLFCQKVWEESEKVVGLKNDEKI